MTRETDVGHGGGQTSDTAVTATTNSRRARLARTTSFAVLLAVALAAGVEAWNLGAWTAGRPGPGLWPLLISVTMFVCVWGAWWRERDTEPDAVPETSWRREFVAFGSIVAYIMGFAYLGLLIPTFLLLVLWLKVLANEPWRLVLPLSAVGTATVYVVFDLLLGVPFPQDILGALGM